MGAKKFQVAVVKLRKAIIAPVTPLQPSARNTSVTAAQIFVNSFMNPLTPNDPCRGRTARQPGSESLLHTHPHTQSLTNSFTYRVLYKADFRR